MGSKAFSFSFFTLLIEIKHMIIYSSSLLRRFSKASPLVDGQCPRGAVIGRRDSQQPIGALRRAPSDPSEAVTRVAEGGGARAAIGWRRCE